MSKIWPWETETKREDLVRDQMGGPSEGDRFKDGVVSSV